MKSSDAVVGAIVGRYTILNIVYEGGRKHANCQCSCGTVKKVRVTHLGEGPHSTSSCGCLRLETHTTHGKKHSKLYSVWGGMLARCNNPNSKSYTNYGGRGIEVDATWLDFSNFLLDMGEPEEGLTLERKDNSLGYSKDNCVWVSTGEQARNRRNNIYVYHKDIGRMVLKDACELLGINYMNTYNKIKRKNLSAADALGSDLITNKEII